MKKLTYYALALALVACTGTPKEQPTRSGLLRSAFQTRVDSVDVDLFTLTNRSGMEVCITNYGGRIVSVMVPDRDGKFRDVILGFDSIGSYLQNKNHVGATVGRYANRIAQGRIILDGDTIQLDKNDHGNMLHGGLKGWSGQVYQAEQLDSSTLVLTKVSPDGEGNFPGTLVAKVTYKVTDDNAIDISYEATTDRKTIVNLTNHTYFNLSGKTSSILAHQLQIQADSFTPIDSLAIPIGDPIAVKGTPMDFTSPKPIGQAIDSTDFKQLKNGIGYDHNWVLNTKGDLSKPAARLLSPESGIVMEVFTIEPGLQVYTGNYLNGTEVGKGSLPLTHRSAICLETQHAPDSPNHANWPSVVLNPGETYHSHCIYRFSTEK